MNEPPTRVFLTGASGFIGTNFVDKVLPKNWEVKNFDRSEPLKKSHAEFWEPGDIMDTEKLAASMAEFAPDFAIHLAARTDCDENTTVENDYQINTQGTTNFLEACRSAHSLKKIIITSSQFVCGPGKLPESDTDYFPHTVYGQSKVETEQLTRAAELPVCWSFIRPVNIWGPYHKRYQNEFWKVASRKWYVQPGGKSPTRTYGYVGNVVWQILELLDQPRETIDKKAFYVGDRPVSIDNWTREFCRVLGNYSPPVIPFWSLKILAVVGDGISFITRKPFLINSSRLKSMTIDYLTPIETTFELLGEPPHSLEDGVIETAKWFNAQT